ncbi:gamma-glutamylcyclotransferase [Aquisalimonas sp. 2447]|uniref:gamma-glutamylcyclotransferase family protein n=1 Tax=Aquisalimonas sp. 2447 TaxID=2740807 RepID=UPI0020C4DE5D
MSLARLQDRVPSAGFVAIGTLPAHRLRCHKVSRDGSGKCDAEETGNPEDRVVGVVYEISDDDKTALDRKEGLGSGYDEKEVEVTTAQGQLTALIYFATNTNSQLKPYRWYKEHVLIGARKNGLPPEYIAQIEAMEAIDDPDTERHDRELAIYR